jgi:hypothetical protein
MAVRYRHEPNHAVAKARPGPPTYERLKSSSPASDERAGGWPDQGSGAFKEIAFFRTTDGREVALPAMTRLRRKGNKVSRPLFVMDAAQISNLTRGGPP